MGISVKKCDGDDEMNAKQYRILRNYYLPEKEQIIRANKANAELGVEAYEAFPVPDGNQRGSAHADP